MPKSPNCIDQHLEIFFEAVIKCVGKEFAPSSGFRKEFGHDPKLWKRFQSKYKKELRSSKAQLKLKELGDIAKKRNVTLIYGAKDEEHNDAVVLKNLLEKEFLRRGYQRT